MKPNVITFVLLLNAFADVVNGQTPPVAHVHHNSSALLEYLLHINESYPNITHLYSIGQSTRGHELWVMAIGENPSSDRILRPSVKYIANMHGNEVVGREHMIHLIDYYVKAYDVNVTITHFLQNTVVHIMPSMNPDGYDESKIGNCKDTGDTVGRLTANGVDLNRNFPDIWHNKHQMPIQNETQAVINWLPKHNFILSGNIQEGGFVVNYPFDQYTNAKKKAGSGPSISPDDDVFRFLSLIFSRSHHTMATTTVKCDGESFKDGITNGAEWYPIAGGMQDYNYLVHGIAELTLEISCCKYPKASRLKSYWDETMDAYINLLMEVHRGVKGVITDESNNVIIGATITIKGRESVPFKSRLRGEYFRLLMPGNYSLQVNATGYNIESKAFEVPEERSVQVVNVTLRQTTSSCVILQSVLQSGLMFVVVVVRVCF